MMTIYGGIVFHLAIAAIIALTAIWLFRSLFPGARTDTGDRKVIVLPKKRYSKSEYLYKRLGDEMN